MNKKDMFIKEKIQQDKEISDSVNKIFENLKGEFIMDNNEKKVIRISFNKFLAIAASFVLVLFVGTNLYAHSLGKPNIFTAIKNLFNVDKEDYNAAEEDINITEESNGVKLTLKTAAMDDNVLIVKYVAEGEKLADEFYTYQDFEKNQIDVNSIWAKLAGENIEGYEGYTLKDVTIMQRDIVEKLKKQGLTDEEAKKLADLGAEAYKEYIGLQLSETKYSEEKAKEKIEQVVAMFESKVTSKYEIITSEDKLSEYKIDAIAQSIEKEENKYIIHAIYNVDTLVDILDKFNLKININKIGAIEGNWNYSVELNKAKLNKRVETIDFYNEYEVVIDSQDAEPAEDFDLKVALKKLSISDFSSVLNIQTIKEQYYNKIDYTNLEKNIFPITFVVLDENNKVIGTSCQTREEAIDANPIVDRIILKDVDYNTEKIIIKMYSNNDNALIETLEVDLKEAKKIMDTSLENIFYIREVGGIQFNYPKDWTNFEIPDICNYRLMSPENLDGKRANLNLFFNKEEYGSNFEELIQNAKDNKYSSINEKGEILIGREQVEGKYFVESYDGEKWMTVIAVAKGTYYEIRFGGDEKLYAKYEAVFEKILKTVTFSEVTLWEELEEQNNSYNEIEKNTNTNNEDNTNVNTENTNPLYGDVNCDGKVNEEDDQCLRSYMAGYDYETFESTFKLSEQGKINADVYKDQVINGKDVLTLKKYLNKVEGYETLPYIPEQEDEEIYLASSMSWTKYTAPGLRFEYPTKLNLKNVDKDKWGGRQGQVSVEISGIATGFNANTKETAHATLSIEIYEPLAITYVDFDALKKQNNYTTSDGLVWYEHLMLFEDGGSGYEYRFYMESTGNVYWLYKIIFTSDVNDFNYDNIITYLLDSVEFISY